MGEGGRAGREHVASHPRVRTTAAAPNPARRSKFGGRALSVPPCALALVVVAVGDKGVDIDAEDLRAYRRQSSHLLLDARLASGHLPACLARHLAPRSSLLL